MKERYELINKEMVDDKEWNWYDIVDIIELSYLFKGKKEIEKLEEIIKECSFDGINTWGIFVKFCFNKYAFSNEYVDFSLDEFAEKELKNCVEEFIDKFFEEEE